MDVLYMICFDWPICVYDRNFYELIRLHNDYYKVYLIDYPHKLLITL